MFGGPTDAQLRAHGLTRADMAGNLVEPWPENREACELLGLFATQWRTGPGGTIGYDYTPVMLHMAAQRIGRRRQQGLLAQLRILESAALKCIQKGDG